MRRRFSVILAVAMMATLFAAAGIYAATQVSDVIEMKNKAYAEAGKKHKKGIVMFEHKKHAEDYVKEFPEFYENGCGECHHDDNNKPLKDLKMGDEVQNCIACHTKLGEAPKGKKAPKLNKKQKREYHGEALHDNCIDCHKKYKKKYKSKKAPTTCTKCHPKKKK